MKFWDSRIAFATNCAEALYNKHCMQWFFVSVPGMHWSEGWIGLLALSTTLLVCYCSIICNLRSINFNEYFPVILSLMLSIFTEHIVHRTKKCISNSLALSLSDLWEGFLPSPDRVWSILPDADELQVEFWERPSDCFISQPAVRSDILFYDLKNAACPQQRERTNTFKKNAQVKQDLVYLMPVCTCISIFAQGCSLFSRHIITSKKPNGHFYIIKLFQDQAKYNPFDIMADNGVYSYQF